MCYLPTPSLCLPEDSRDKRQPLTYGTAAGGWLLASRKASAAQNKRQIGKDPCSLDLP